MARTDLRPHLGRFEAGAVVNARVARHDERYELTSLAFDGGELVVPNVDALPGEPVRARIRARDVSLAIEKPAGLSVQNILEATVRSVSDEYGAIIDVELQVGATLLIARVTRKAVAELRIAPGVRVYALISVGFA